MILAANIREFRKKNGLTQRELAQILGVSRESVVKYELDQSKPSVESLIILAEQFGVSLDRLVFGHETSNAVYDIELEERFLRCGGRRNALQILDAVLSIPNAKRGEESKGMTDKAK